jgi:hypothetical protein
MNPLPLYWEMKNFMPCLIAIMSCTAKIVLNKLGLFQTPTQPLRGNEKKYNVSYEYHYLIQSARVYPTNLIFSLFPSMTGKTCSGSLVLFGCGIKNMSAVQGDRAENFYIKIHVL